ncbi:MAG: hypothetical protein KY467_00885 [Gemmatimonadetes bacterium]|nr:hypothetical protein [Gemmatimonadota bacterium]
MWKSLYELVRTIIQLSERVQEDREEIKELRRDLRDLTLIVERLSSQLVHVSEREERERAMLVLQLENGIVRSRRALLVGEADGNG